MEELIAKNNGKKKWILFIDFAKAYDQVNHHILFAKMERMQIKQEVVDGVKMMFNNLVIQVADQTMHIGRGLGQGWSISCLLFNIFTDDLTKQII